MHASSLALLCLLLRASLQQSGDFSENDEDEEPGNDVQPNFTCFSKIRMRNVLLFCNVTSLPPGILRNITFEVQRGSERFLKPWTKPFAVEFGVLLLEYEVCMHWIAIENSPKNCQFFNVEKIAIPDCPTNVTIIYNEDLGEYVCNIHVTYGTNDYLKDSLEHELVLRKEGAAWPDCKDGTFTTRHHKMCFHLRTLDLYVPQGNLEYSTKYEARVRSKPIEYFHGSWSPWSPITTFKTEENRDMTSTVPIALSTSVPFFMLIVVILIAVFWKSRIKPFVWPEIPDHKKTLEKLCSKPKQNIHININPYYYEIVPINKIDYIKAPEMTEDNGEFGVADLCMGMPSLNTCNTSLSPAEGSSRSVTNANHTELSDQLTNDGENTSGNSLNSGTVMLLPRDGVSEKCNPSDISDGIKPVVVRHPGHGSKGLCWEDIYIAMSAFKTPGSAVKQAPKSTC